MPVRSCALGKRAALRGSSPYCLFQAPDHLLQPVLLARVQVQEDGAEVADRRLARQRHVARRGFVRVRSRRDHRLPGYRIDVAHFQVGDQPAEVAEIHLHAFQHLAALGQFGRGQAHAQAHAVDRDVAHREGERLGLGLGEPGGLAAVGAGDQRGAEHLAPLDPRQAVGKGDTRAALPSSKWITSGRCTGSGSARPIGRGVKVEGGAAEQAHAVGLFEVRAGVVARTPSWRVCLSAPG